MLKGVNSYIVSIHRPAFGWLFSLFRCEDLFMLLRLLSILFISLLALSLSACSDQSDYMSLLKNQQRLQAKLQACGSSTQSISCQRAQAVAKALSLFSEVQQIQAQRFPNAAQAMQHYQMLVAQAGQSKQLRDQIQSELAGVDRYYLSVAENYAKQVMSQEIHLSKLKQRYASLDKGSTTYVEDKRQLAKQIQQSHFLVQAMLALVNLNSGGQ